MAALAFILLSTGYQFYRVGRVFFSSGFSISKCIIYVKQLRRELLYKRYLEELNLKFECDKSASLGKMDTEREHRLLKSNRMSIYNEYSSDENEIEIIDGYEIDEINATFYDFVDPNIVYSNSNLSKFRPGDSFMIKGVLLKNCERFSINFILNTPNRDVALHINPRLPQNYIVRNSKIKGIWGKEEVTSGYPLNLKRGENFIIQVLIIDKEFLISVNSRHFASYAHRLPFQQITCLEIKGDVENVNVEREEVTTYPEILPEIQSITNLSKSSLSIDVKKSAEDVKKSAEDVKNSPEDVKNNAEEEIKTQPSSIISCGTTSDVNSSDVNVDVDVNISNDTIITQSTTNTIVESEKTKSEWDSEISYGFDDESIDMPLYGKFTEKFIYGKYLKIRGRVKLLPHSFYINLQKGHYVWPHPIIAFHFNPRFANVGGKHIICRNSWFDNKWSKEERSQIKTDFMPGRPFTLCIYCGEKGYEVYLNKKFLTEYKYRVEPDIVDTVYLQGDIKLWEIALKEGNPGKSKKI